MPEPMSIIPSRKLNSWQHDLQQMIRSPQELFAKLQLPEDLLANSTLAHKDFELRLTQHYLSLIKPGDINDPLLKQVLPCGDELHSPEDFILDPLQENLSNPQPGLLHKYHGRVLLVIASQCAINCRYCFRRHFPYAENRPNRQQWLQLIDYIGNDDSITEVIYSGGDPLSLADKQLAWLSAELDQIPHLKRLRIHTRLPVVIPNRIDEALLSWLQQSRLSCSIVLHINHPQEISPELIDACQKLHAIGVRLFNQSVLLKGINDDWEVLSELSESLFEAGIQPYYLHQLDKVAGAAHFLVSDERAKELYYQLRDRLPGYLVPLLSREEPGAGAKTPLL